MTRRPALRAALIALLLFALAPRVAAAQDEIPPPSGKGRVVVVVSGQSGPGHYYVAASKIAALGYDVVLYDGRKMEGTRGKALGTAIAEAQRLPHAVPGKVGLVGFSLGGAIVLGYGSAWADRVAVVAAWCPATGPIRNVPRFAGRLAVPVVMFAGESDTYHDCCLIDKARQMAAAAAARQAQFELTAYPGIDHDFVIGGSHYDTRSYDDAFARTAAALKRHLGD